MRSFWKATYLFLPPAVSFPSYMKGHMESAVQVQGIDKLIGEETKKSRTQYMGSKNSPNKFSIKTLRLL